VGPSHRKAEAEDEQVMNRERKQRFEFENGRYVVYAKDFISAKAALRRHQAKLTQGTTGMSMARELTRQQREAAGAAKAREVAGRVTAERRMQARRFIELAKRRDTLRGRLGLYAEKKVREIPGLMLKARRKAEEHAPAVKARAKIEARAFARGGKIVSKKVASKLWNLIKAEYAEYERREKSQRRLRR
jgi:hypothetical protein